MAPVGLSSCRVLEECIHGEIKANLYYWFSTTVVQLAAQEELSSTHCNLDNLPNDGQRES